MPRSINHTGTPYKYQLDLFLQKSELILSNPLGKLSFVFRINNQRIESLQRPKALKEVLLNEAISSNITLYETSESNYEEAILHIDMFLNQTKSSKIIGVADIVLTNLANSCNREEIGDNFSIIMDKSPEYKAKLSLSINIKCLGIEVIEKPNLNNKKRGHSNILKKNYEFEEGNSEILNSEDLDLKQKFHQIGKTRSVTPTPVSNSMAKQTMKSEIIEKKKPINNRYTVNNTVDHEYKSEEIIDSGRKPQEKVEKTKKSPQQIKDQNYTMSTPPVKKVLENIAVSTIPNLSETINTTMETSAFKKDSEEYQPRRRDTFGYKGDDQENNEDVSILEENKDNTKQLENLKQENKTLLKEKVRLENLLAEMREVKKTMEKEQNEKLVMISRENNSLKDELSKKNQEHKNLSVKNEEMMNILEEKEIEVRRLEDLAAGLQKEILLLRKEIKENKGTSGNSESIQQLKSVVQRLEEEVQEKTNEKNEIYKKKEEELKELKKANALLMENNTKLQQNLLAYSKEFGNEKLELKEELKKIDEHRDNLKKELGRKDTKIQELEENFKSLQQRYVKTKEEVADIINLIFEKGGIELMEEIEGYMANLSEISRDFEAKLSEKR